MNAHTREELRMYQALPLSLKVSLTCDRIRAWVNEFGEDGVYVAFSGGKDSTVLLDLVREKCGYKRVRAMFEDVPTQYPELKEFVKTFSDVDIVKPKISFVEVCKKYGFPLISKEVSSAVHYGKKYLAGETKSKCHIDKLKGTGSYEDKHEYAAPQWEFLLDAPFNISDRCCATMKKEPAHRYAKETGRKSMTAMMADESRRRQSAWIKHGCNAFDAKEPSSMPMAFWTENDVLEYIYKTKLPICSVYGEVIPKNSQLLFDIEGVGKFETTGCKRTGCMLCGFGCHLEKSPNRFEMLRETHPSMHKLFDACKNNGVTYREAIEWINEHGGLNIKL